MPDTSRPAYEGDRDRNASLRLTWQASPKNKISLQHQWGDQLRDHFYSQSTTNRTQAPEATIYYHGAAVVPGTGDLERADDEQTPVRGWRRRSRTRTSSTSCRRRTASRPPPRRSPISARATAGAASAACTATTRRTTSTRNSRPSYVTGSHAAKAGITYQHPFGAHHPEPDEQRRDLSVAQRRADANHAVCDAARSLDEVDAGRTLVSSARTSGR